MDSNDPYEISHNPYERYTDDDLAGIVSMMHDLGRHSGYKLLMEALQKQYDELLARLVRTNDAVDFPRTQGAVRAVADILDLPHSLSPTDCLRVRILSAAEYEIASRKEDIDA